jgi:hypothetical protein
MPSTFTPNTGIEQIADGEQSGLWGQTTNLNFDIVDRALNGVGTITLSGTTHTLTTSAGILSDGQFAVLVFAGSLSASNTVTIAPDTAQKLYFVRNTTSQTVILSQGSGATVSVPAGASKIVYTNGAGATAAVFDVTNTLSGTFTGNVTGNASTATALQNARTIGGVSFDGTANINLPGVNATGNQNTTGSAATLTTPRTLTIGSTGKTFNGSADVAWNLTEIGAVAPSRQVASGTGLTGGGDLSADRTLALDGQALALHNLATNGLIARTGSGTVVGRTLTAGTGITVTNGDGVSGNPTVGAVTLSQAEAENPASTVFGAVSGQRLAQAVAANASVTTSTVLAATAGATAGEVGTLLWGRRNTTGNIALDATVAGSSLTPAGALTNVSLGSVESGSVSTATGTARAGTWRCLGQYTHTATASGSLSGGGATLWLRIS